MEGNGSMLTRERDCAGQSVMLCMAKEGFE
jgi:hypothetical protein